MLASGLIWLLLRQQKISAEQLREQAVTHRAVELRQLDVIEKSFAQLRASDPWQYQAIQAMTQAPLYDEVYDPSEEAEARRIAERMNTTDQQQEALDGEAEHLLGDLFPGS